VSARRERRELRRQQAIRLAETQLSGDLRLYEPAYNEPANLTDYFRHLDELPRGWKVVLVCRVSSGGQYLNENLADQERFLRRIAAERGLIVVGVYRCVSKGYEHFWYPAAMMAVEHFAVLLWKDVSRCIRPRGWTPANKIPLSVAEAEDVKRSVVLPMFTVAHPSATEEEIAALNSTEGQKAKGNRGGRPVKGRDRFREKWEPKAIELDKQGWPQQAIAWEIERLYGRPITQQAVGKGLKRIKDRL
jgi:hypothetical protein